MTHSEEDYIKAIYQLGDVAVATNTLADKMKTKPSSVTDMVQKLSEKGWVNYVKYKGVSLTEKGFKKALTLVRKHRLWEVFLVERLDFNWDEVHEIAEQLEHIQSEKLVDELDRHLNYPKVDPHGDPIPSKDGIFSPTQKELLSTFSIGDSGVCIGVKDSSKHFLKFLDKKQIALGDQITVLDREAFDGSLRIEINTKQMDISREIAANLYIEKQSK